MGSDDSTRADAGSAGYAVGNTDPTKRGLDITIAQREREAAEDAAAALSPCDRD